MGYSLCFVLCLLCFVLGSIFGIVITVLRLGSPNRLKRLEERMIRLEGRLSRFKRKRERPKE